jgi:hypothetical protein
MDAQTDPQPEQTAQVIDLAAVRKSRNPSQPALAVPFDALHRYNDLARQINVHESRQISPWEAWNVVHNPGQLGLGHGKLANRFLNPPAQPRHDHAS